MPGLDPEIVLHINHANDLYAQGDFAGSATALQGLLNTLDNRDGGRYQRVEARLIVMSLYKMAFAQNDFLQAKKWAQESFNFSVPANATSELMNLGAVHFQLGEFDDAWDCFLQAYEKGKHRAFSEERPEYWAFFNARREKR